MRLPLTRGCATFEPVAGTVGLDAGMGKRLPGEGESRLDLLSLLGRNVGDLQEALGALEVEAGRRLTAEEHRSELEQNLALTLASIDAGMITTDLAGLVVRMNAVAERITGWTQQEACGYSYWDIFVCADRTAGLTGRNVVQVMLEHGFTMEDAHRVVAVSRHGPTTPVEVKAALTRTGDGAVRGVLAILKDVTAVVRAEEDARRLAAIVESSTDAIVGKTLDGRITTWNHAAAELFGYTAEEAIGQSVRMLLPADRLEEEMDIIARIAGGRVVPAFDTVRLARGGRPVDVSVTISPIRDGAGRIVGAAKIARDIGVQRRTFAALRESEARLKFALDVARIGDWDLDLRSGTMQRSIRHDACFGYRELQREWSIATFLAHVHADERDVVALSFREALRRSQDWDVECRVVWPDDSLHWIRIQGSRRYEVGNPDRMLGIVAEVKARS